jgi:hypothetical protein
MMEVRQVTGEHWFDKFTTVLAFLVRAHCTCGWRSRPCLTMDGASNALIRHEYDLGTPL